MTIMQALSSARGSRRERAHRNVLIAAVSAAFTQRVIGPADRENYRPDAPEVGSHTYRFEIPSRIPAAAHIHELGGELAFHVALWPADDLGWLAAVNAGYDAGEAFATGWLEREEGLWLQDRFCDACIRKALLPQLAELRPVSV